MSQAVMQLLFAVLSIVLPGCEGRYEDETNIYWNAQACGNGEGRSFVSIEAGDNRFLVIYETGEYRVVD